MTSESVANMCVCVCVCVSLSLQKKLSDTIMTHVSTESL